MAALNQADTTDFGYMAGTKYSFTFLCTVTTGVPLPPPLPGASQLISYLMLNHMDPNAGFPG